MSEDHDDYDDLPAGDGILILSSDQVILSATLQAERLLRTRLEPGQTLALSDIFPEPYLAQAELALKETLDSGVLRAQLLTQILLPAEKVRFLKYSVAPLYGQDRKIIGAVLAFHDDILTKSWSDWSDFGLGVKPGAVFEHLDRGLFIVNQRRIIQPHGAGGHRL